MGYVPGVAELRELVGGWRKRAGLTQAQLATSTGVSEATISHIETGARGLGADNVRPMAQALKLSAKEAAQLEEARKAYRNDGGLSAKVDSTVAEVAALRAEVAELRKQVRGARQQDS